MFDMYSHKWYRDVICRSQTNFRFYFYCKFLPLPSRQISHTNLNNSYKKKLNFSIKKNIWLKCHGNVHSSTIKRKFSISFIRHRLTLFICSNLISLYATQFYFFLFSFYVITYAYFCFSVYYFNKSMQ